MATLLENRLDTVLSETTMIFIAVEANDRHIRPLLIRAKDMT
jgi:hypothetical protein